MANDKNKFQDIIPPERRSIRNIPLPKGREVRTDGPPPTIIRPKRSVNERPVNSDNLEIRRTPPVPIKRPPPGYPEFESSERGSNWRAGIWLIVLIALVILFFGVSYIFAGADVKVTPKSQSVAIDQTLNADKASTDNGLIYSLITLDKEGATSVTGNGTESVSTKASGDIIIYNAYSAQSQTLIATTRFETPEGLVYRINKDVTVPGQTTVNGQVTPGSVEATVYADQPGEKYNSGVKDFTIPGFQGTPKYNGFYARSKTPLSGGFVGTVPKVTDADVATAHATIEADLDEQLLTQANSQKPVDYILYPGALITSYSPESNISGTTSTSVLVREAGTANAILLNRDLLNRQILSNLNVNSASSTLEGLDNLTFTLENQNSFDPTGSSTAISFRLNGNVQMVSIVDTDLLKSDLAGASRSKLSSILADFPSIKEAEVVFKPFWSWSFPNKASKIEVQVATSTTT